MDELFSCRNCIHNCGQSLNIGQGIGYCLKHNSVIREPEKTTCKYLHRKDLPHFVVDEGVREHAGEFAGFSAMATLDTMQPIQRVRYSERYLWQQGEFDPLTQALAQYYKISRRWVLIQAFSAGADGRRSLAHASLTRHYMEHCGTWVSSYRLIMGLIEEIDDTPVFTLKALRSVNGASRDSVEEQALWDVVFARISAIQEYGWHAGLESLTWASDTINGAFSDFRWDALQQQLAGLRERWLAAVVDHAKNNGTFFPKEARPDHRDSNTA